MTLSDNPIGASYLYLLEPEIRFLEAAVEHLIPTDELGPGARDAGVVTQRIVERAGAIAFKDANSKRLNGSEIYFPVFIEVSKDGKRGGCSENSKARGVRFETKEVPRPIAQHNRQTTRACHYRIEMAIVVNISRQCGVTVRRNPYDNGGRKISRSSSK